MVKEPIPICEKISEGAAMLGPLLGFAMSSLLFFNAHADASVGDETMNFKIFLEEQEIGWHRFTLITNGEELEVSSEAIMDFTVLLIKKVEYRHQARELWKDGCLQSFSATTRRDKKVITVSGSINSGQFVVQQKVKKIQLGSCVKSFAYWKPEWIEDDFLLNVETGKYTPVSLQVKKQPTIGITTKILGLPKTEILLEYDKSGVWQSLESKVRLVGKLRYKRVEERVGEADEIF